MKQYRTKILLLLKFLGKAKFIIGWVAMWKEFCWKYLRNHQRAGILNETRQWQGDGGNFNDGIVKYERKHEICMNKLDNHKSDAFAMNNEVVHEIHSSVSQVKTQSDDLFRLRTVRDERFLF